MVEVNCEREDGNKVMKRNLNVYRSFVCPQCFNQVNKCTCKFFPPTSLIFIDQRIQEHIRILNEKGYKTIGCCESHYKGICVSIYVAFGQHWDFKTMPAGFFYDRRRRMIVHDYDKKLTEEEFNTEKEICIATFLEWCKSL